MPETRSRLTVGDGFRLGLGMALAWLLIAVLPYVIMTAIAAAGAVGDPRIGR